MESESPSVPPPPPSSPPSAAARAPRAVAFAGREIRVAFLLPHRLIDLVLSERQRLAANLEEKHQLPALFVLLLLGSILFSLPYGLIEDRERFWRVAMLFVGSLGICAPSLIVFSSYLGLKMRPEQQLVLALTIPSAAALFSFGFFPVQWFLTATMSVEHTHVDAAAVSRVLLSISLLLGLTQLNRFVFGSALLRGRSGERWTILLWQGLLIFITLRMAEYLEMF